MFLENLRHVRHVSIPVWISEQQARDRQNLQLALKAKKQFEKSGMPGLIRDLLKKTPELKFVANSLEDWTSYESLYYLGGFSYQGEYSCEVILEDVPTYHDDPMTKVFVGIVMSPDGTIMFNGDGERGSSILANNTWRDNNSILRDALGRAYENPQREIRGPNYYYEAEGM